ncbi:HyaD/HybD family hydrogenase maturation endopeptidase [Campylobacter mucosalis]|uniref:HyaD/HybD family hydrogenase maturation endopeptidase n=1 Tax=Campylobacter mucosalis TaxID=202 RepID=UPI00146FF471|nr:HyaD/HybD family hydrogenase maturation endopeptidase [Campylobacter mucosalis]
MRVLVLGIGNVMFGDEGIGVHLAMAIEQSYKFSSASHSLKFIDGGTLAVALTPIIADCDYLIVIDCVSSDDANVGDVYFFDIDNMPQKIRWDGSAHEVEMLQTLELMALSGDRPKGKILGLVPSRIEPMSFKLSEQILNGSKVAEKTLINHLNEFGFKCEKIADISPQDMADIYAKKGIK